MFSKKTTMSLERKYPFWFSQDVRELLRGKELVKVPKEETVICSRIWNNGKWDKGATPKAEESMLRKMCYIRNFALLDREKQTCLVQVRSNACVFSDLDF